MYSIYARAQHIHACTLTSLTPRILFSGPLADTANVFQLTTHQKGEKRLCELVAPSASLLKEFRRQLNQLKADLMKLRAKLKEVGAGRCIPFICPLLHSPPHTNMCDLAAA
jgi:hypothetical protein